MQNIEKLNIMSLLKMVGSDQWDGRYSGYCGGEGADGHTGGEDV